MSDRIKKYRPKNKNFEARKTFAIHTIIDLNYKQESFFLVKFTPSQLVIGVFIKSYLVPVDFVATCTKKKDKG